MTFLKKMKLMKADAEACNIAMKAAQGVGLGVMSEPPKRSTPRTIIERRKVVYKLHMQGVSNTDIANRLGVDRGTVVRDMKAIGGRYE